MTLARAVLCALLLAQVPQLVPQTAPAQTLPVEVVVLDRDGKIADALTAASFAVTVDGKPRQVLSVRYVSRGPGASDEAARRLATGVDETLRLAAEPARNVLVVVDEFSIQRGNERVVHQAAAALIDRLGLDDRVGVLRIPVIREAQLTLSTERPDVREALRAVVGQATPTAGVNAVDAFPPPPATIGSDPGRAVTDPDRAAAVERAPTEAVAPSRASEDASAPQSGFLANFQVALNALRASRGRKILAVFSAGFSQGSVTRIDDVARAAVAAHATIYAIGLPGGRDDPNNPLDVGALERLAKATGGAYTLLGKNADKSLERVMPELAGCYVLGIERVPTDADGSRHALRIDIPRQPLTIRAPGWLVARQDVDDVVPAAISAGSTGSAGRGSAARERSDAGGRPPTASAASVAGAPAAANEASVARTLELQRLVARAADYVAGYEREYSMLVAEENYVQSVRGQRQQLRSDLLLVRQENVKGWTSFRDVFEVNGDPVRDRDDRLKRLFLDQSKAAQDQLLAIKTESARYNIGPVGRNMNVPLHALEFLEYANLSRFRFKLGGTRDVGGVVSTRIDYEETGRPTLTRYNQTGDVAARGWFLIDPASGAVTSSMLQFKFGGDGSTLELVVKYGRDAMLGLWVPVEMTESYSRNPFVSGGSAAAIDSRATYSKFRRFQVKAETEIRIAK